MYKLIFKTKKCFLKNSKNLEFYWEINFLNLRSNEEKQKYIKTNTQNRITTEHKQKEMILSPVKHENVKSFT